MATYHYGLKEGKEIKVSLCKSGVSKKGFKWTTFKHSKSSKDKETGRYQQEALYEIWVANGVEIKDGDIVKIERIASCELKYYIKNNIKYYYVVLWCNIALVEEAQEQDNGIEFDENNIEQFDVGDSDLDDLF